MAEPVYDPKLEIRKLPPSVTRELARLLDFADYWKDLMAIIPKQLSSTTFVADVKPDNLPKYNSEHFKIIEQAGSEPNKSCTEILIQEWGTSGKIRANLGILRYLLVKAELFQAADYVSKLINQPPPPRPVNGPARAITTNLPGRVDRHLEEIERDLDKINYPEIAINKIRKKSDETVALPAQGIPKIVISEVDNNEGRDFNAPVVIQKEKPKEPVNHVQNSDVMPNFSVLLQESEVKNEISSVNLPNISEILNSLDSISDNNDQSTSNSFTPAFSQILNNSASLIESNAPIPPLSQLLSDQTGDSILEGSLPDLDVLNLNENISSSNIIPNLSLLNTQSDQASGSVQIYDSDSKNSSGSSNKCPSPLPNLSLNTELPHFRYCELEHATNNFSDTPFKSIEDEGRFLGKGAFGSVFLATGLAHEFLAVKKIFLENVEVVNEDDQVTKQFKNEVEFLSKYKHKNLVSLLGYSCDGPTYCLVYEYVPGGTLCDILKENPQKLPWQQRLKISIGTAEAIAYLHTAFSTPIIHRDIKSANILLDGDNNPKLGDFGIIKLLPNQKTDTYTAPFGTSAYMSPECLRGDISIKLDTYSFGVVLVELMTSLPPIDTKRQGIDLVTYMLDKCEEDIEPILDRTIGSWEHDNINFAEKLFKLALKCLEDNKKKRPEMVQVVDELRQIVQLLD